MLQCVGGDTFTSFFEFEVHEYLKCLPLLTTKTQTVRLSTQFVLFRLSVRVSL